MWNLLKYICLYGILMDVCVCESDAIDTFGVERLEYKRAAEM